MKQDDMLCYCFHIRKRKIVNFLRIHQPRVASQLSECGGAGTGCGWCIPFLKQCFAQTDDQMTAEEYATARGEYSRAGNGRPPAGAIPPPDVTP